MGSWVRFLCVTSDFMRYISSTHTLGSWEACGQELASSRSSSSVQLRPGREVPISPGTVPTCPVDVSHPPW